MQSPPQCSRKWLYDFNPSYWGAKSTTTKKGTSPAKYAHFTTHLSTKKRKMKKHHTFPPFLSLFYLRFSSCFPPSPDSDSVQPRQNTATDTQRFGFIDVADGQLLACGKYIEHELDDHRPREIPNQLSLKQCNTQKP